MEKIEQSIKQTLLSIEASGLSYKTITAENIIVQDCKVYLQNPLLISSSFVIAISFNSASGTLSSSFIEGPYRD